MTELSESDYDAHIPMGDLPLAFNQFMGETRTQSFLVPDRTKTKVLRKRLSTERKVCGLSWESKRWDIGKSKSLALEDLLPLLIGNDLDYVNLQYGETKPQLDRLLNAHHINIHEMDEIDKYNDLDGLASLIDACDFVVTTSNTTAHICGALGKKTYLLAPRKGRALQWYWSNNNDRHSLLYPSIIVFHQKQNNDWASAIEDVRKSISIDQ